jgi:uncharacterized protein
MPKRRHEAVRTCVACRQEAGKAALIRIVRGSDGVAHVDPTGHASGRGAYLHRDSACIDTARKRRQLERALGASVASEVWSELTA